MIQSESIEKLMKIQLVSEQQDQGAMQELMMSEMDVEEFVYESPSEESAGGAFQEGAMAPLEPAGDSAKKKMSWQAGPSTDPSKLNRAERRRQQKKK